MVKRLLVQTQLSNIVNGKFDLACDSGWQMTINRCREMLKLCPDLHIDIMGPALGDSEHDPTCQVVESPHDVTPDLWEKYGYVGAKRLKYLGENILPNALVTRYDFQWFNVVTQLDLGMHKIETHRRYDAVYLNDPMLLRAFKAMFYVVGGYQPKFFVHSHFVDLPEFPKFPKEASLWLGQCEATIKADFNFWQCESAMEQFFESMGKWFKQELVDDVRTRSLASDDGYSITEITQPVDESRMRFTVDEWNAKTQGKIVLFFPNRISPSSGDYTNGMRFMFDLLPKLRQRRNDFVVVCGNPNLKFSNDELVQRCGADGYVKLHNYTLDRNEYRFVAAHSDIALGLYDNDTYGGTAARECIELGCVPLWLALNEYSSLAREARCDHYVLAKPDFSDLVDVVDHLMSISQEDHFSINTRLRRVVKSRCSYEQTVPEMLRLMDLL